MERIRIFVARGWHKVEIGYNFYRKRNVFLKELKTWKESVQIASSSRSCMCAWRIVYDMAKIKKTKTTTMIMTAMFLFHHNSSYHMLIDLLLHMRSLFAQLRRLQ